MFKWVKRILGRNEADRSAQKFGRYTDRSRKLMVIANEYAKRKKCAEITPEHMLLAMICEETDMGVGKWMLSNQKVDLAKLRERLGGSQEVGVTQATDRKLPQSRLAKDVIVRSIGESKDLGDDYVGTEHLLLAMTLVHGTRGILEESGLPHAKARVSLQSLRVWEARKSGDTARVMKELEALLRDGAGDVVVINDVAWMLATWEKVLDRSKALELAKAACEATGFGNAAYLDTLAAAHAVGGNFAEAIRWQTQVVAMEAEDKGGKERLASYCDGKVWVEK